MPVIDPAQLRPQATALAAKFGNPDAMIADLRHLLIDYADTARRRRSTALPADRVTREEYGTPPPVLRAVVNALRKRIVAAPLASLVLVEKIWRGGSREEARLAADLFALAAPGAPSEALRLLETWLSDLDDGDAADALATIGCAPLMSADPRARLKDARRWLASENYQVRRFGVMAIAALARDKTFHDPAALLDPLHGVMNESSPDLRKAVAAALRDITSAGQVEVARFLRDYALAADPAAHWIVRHGMTRLTTE
ncbi:MAG: DNA alkylation repair protein, partial [Chloroflexi bacterium]|nr:DNA alkylation repair protein [Chloroflexota bacterium]